MMKGLDNKLTENQIRPTAMRLLVLEFLMQQPAAISLSDLYNSFEHSDRITLYRTLKTFEEKGLVHSIEDGTGAPKYALCKDDCQPLQHHDLHVHFLCNTCKETYCLPKSKIPEVPLPDHFLSEDISLLVKGVCARCR